MTDHTDNFNTSGPAPGNGRRRFFFMLVLPGLLLAAGAMMYLNGGRYIETDNAYVRADKVPVSAQVSGTVVEVLVQENQMVDAGQPLFRIDPAPFEIAVNKAQAQLAQVRADLAALKANYHETEAQLALQRTRVSFAGREEQRQSSLRDKQYISAAAFDSAQQANALARQEVSVLQQELERLAQMLGGSIDTPLEEHPRYRAAQAELDEAQLDLRRTTVGASLTGSVSNLPKPGQYLRAGSMAAALVGSERPWIEANFPETDLTYVRPGQPVEVRIDVYPDVVWHGVVESLSPATGSEFSVIPAQNATGNWVKIVQRVPVRIRLERTVDSPVLLAGLSSLVEVDTGHRRSLLGLTL
ncbi:HlyD family secretion protein [Halopseudomonas aestusnigri]|uniref:HlyD family secretion protein n=1 Tax=Halopseudomonas aestusnigri TaxID=857252 RepID=UPI001E3EF167|nr:HlyD family secretion protein [Halopseudomonas aestusnigri]UGV32063.1 HlyD family secretion protein [Halopseudomonas aestusnigri]